MSSLDLVRLSVLDRLVGQRPERGTPGSPVFGEADGRVPVGQFKEVLRRDIEWLLNTRRVTGPEAASDVRGPGSSFGDVPGSPPGTWPESARSILAYGLPDLSGFSASSQDDKARLVRLFETVLRTFETRLEPDSVKATILPNPDDASHSMRVRITAVARMEDLREVVAFDTWCDPGLATLSVELHD